MSRKSLPIKEILSALAETPRQLAELTKGLTTAQLHTAPKRGEWSANDVLAHLRACADMWGACIVTIIDQDEPTIRAINPRRWIKSTDYHQQKFKPSLRAFTKQRAVLLKVLKLLKPKDWARTATITGGGQPRVRSVQAFALRLVLHERPHLKQIKRFASTRRK
jgi:hypothetical protein